MKSLFESTQIGLIVALDIPTTRSERGDKKEEETTSLVANAWHTLLASTKSAVNDSVHTNLRNDGRT